MLSVSHNCRPSRLRRKQERWLAIWLMASLILTQSAALPALAEGDSGAAVSAETPPPPPPDSPPPPPSDPAPSADAPNDAGSSDASPATTEPPATASSDPVTTIETSDATAEFDVTNAVNTNATALLEPNGSGEAGAEGPNEAEPQTTAAGDPQSSGEASDNPAGGTEPPPAGDDPPADGITPAQATSSDPASIDADISNTNAATTANDAAGLAVSGANAASTTEGDVSITTGNALSGANVTNLVNTNAVGSELALVAINQSSSTASIDLRPEFSTSTQNSLFDPAASTTLRVTNANAATTTNDITLVAQSGANDAAAQCGNTAISTGTAQAGANVINFVNANFVGSRLAVVAVNQLGDWFGDLILPGQPFFTSFFGSQIYSTSSEEGGPIPPPIEAAIANTNRASVANEVAVNAMSGGNAALGSAGAGINTGTSSAVANIANFVNTNVFHPGGSRLSVLINVGGRWDGAAYSVPPAVRLENQGGRLVAEYGPRAASALTAASSEPYDLPDRLRVENANTAVIENHIQVLASSGENAAVAGCGEAEITTGSAAAAANIINFANTNVIGTNWFLALVNVAGNWAGNLAFGQPDLWLGALAEVESGQPAGIDGKATYVLTVMNRGDAAATGVTLTDRFNQRHIRVLSNSDGGILSSPGEISWDIGTLPIGGMAIRSYTAHFSDLPYGDTELINRSTVTETEADGNPDDNADTMSVWTRNHLPQHSENSPNWPVDLSISKTNDATSPIAASSTVRYKIVVKNLDVGTGFDTRVVDTLRDPSGNVLKKFTWDIGELGPRRKAIVDYTVAFAANALPGIYVNSAYAETRENGRLIRSAIATSSVEIIGRDTAGAGATAATTTPAAPEAGTAPADEPAPGTISKKQRLPSLSSILAGAVPAANAAPVPVPPAFPRESWLAAAFAGIRSSAGLIAVFLVSLAGAMLLRRLEERRR